MVDKCESCTEKCPQAEMAHQAALGRMNTTREFITLLKKVESGELVEVVRCRECKHYDNSEGVEWCHLNSHFYQDVYDWHSFPEDGFCSYGERKNDENT